MSDDLDPFRSHQIMCLIDALSDWTGVRADLCQVAYFVSFAAGVARVPIHVEVLSDDPHAERLLVNAILSLLPSAFERVDGFGQFRAVERSGFRDTAVILVRGTHQLFARLIECTAHWPDEYEGEAGAPVESGLPSIIRVNQDPGRETCIPGTLRLLTHLTSRDLTSLQSRPRRDVHSDSAKRLVDAFNALRSSHVGAFEHRTAYRAKLSTTDGLVFDHILHVFAALRTKAIGLSVDRARVSIEDYAAARALLTQLPLLPHARNLSPGAVRLGDVVYQRLHEGGYQRFLPRRTDLGNKLFTRQDAAEWAKCSYNTAKKRLDELEQEGLVLATIKKGDRDHGREIYFRIKDGVVPPFDLGNPFDTLPDPAELTSVGTSQDCNGCNGIARA